MARLTRADVHLEVCPGSNVQIGVVATLFDHPVAALDRAGVPLSISTDARAVGDTTLEQEYAGLGRAHGWGEGTFRRCNGAALDAAFLPEDAKRRLRLCLAAS